MSDALLDRALRFADLLLRAADGQGWRFVTPPLPQARSDGYNRQSENPAPSGPPLGAIWIGDELIRFEIEERVEIRRLPPTERELARQAKNPYHHPNIRTETIPSGVLRRVRPALPYPYYVSRKSWYDRGHQRLETKIGQILQDFAQTAAVVKARREEIQREQRERAEAERFRAEEQKRRAANSRFIAELERQAGAWEYARRLRRYVRAAKRALGERRFFWTFQDQPVDFLAWAENYVEEIDPLHPTPLHSDRTPDRRSYGGIGEETVHKIVGRWLNRDEYVPHHVVLEARDPTDPAPPETREPTQTSNAEDEWEE